jgi:hypothetical protein
MASADSGSTSMGERLGDQLREISPQETEPD